MSTHPTKKKQTRRVQMLQPQQIRNLMYNPIEYPIWFDNSKKCTKLLADIKTVHIIEETSRTATTTNNKTNTQNRFSSLFNVTANCKPIIKWEINKLTHLCTRLGCSITDITKSTFKSKQHNTKDDKYR